MNRFDKETILRGVTFIGCFVVVVVGILIGQSEGMFSVVAAMLFVSFGLVGCWWAMFSKGFYFRLIKKIVKGG